MLPVVVPKKARGSTHYCKADELYSTLYSTKGLAHHGILFVSNEYLKESLPCHPCIYKKPRAPSSRTPNTVPLVLVPALRIYLGVYMVWHTAGGVGIYIYTHSDRRACSHPPHQTIRTELLPSQIVRPPFQAHPISCQTTRWTCRSMGVERYPSCHSSQEESLTKRVERSPRHYTSSTTTTWADQRGQCAKSDRDDARYARVAPWASPRGVAPNQQ